MPEVRRRKASKSSTFRHLACGGCGLFRGAAEKRHHGGHGYKRRTRQILLEDWDYPRQFENRDLCLCVEFPCPPWLRHSRLFQLELLDAIADLIAVQPEQGGRPRLIPSTAFERLDHQRAFELLEVDAVR